MSITLPTVDELIVFWGDEAADVDEERAELLISLSGDLLYLATGLDKDPTDARLKELVKYGIIDMAINMHITRDDINANYSPFASERIGSYNYSKQYDKMAKQIAMNQATGVPLFDRVVSELLDILAYGGGTVVAGQRVANETYVPLFVEASGSPADRDLQQWGMYRVHGFPV